MAESIRNLMVCRDADTISSPVFLVVPSVANFC